MQIANTNFISSEQLQELELNFKKRYDYGNIKSNTKPEFYPLFRFLEKPHGCQIDPPTGILELSTEFFLTI